MNNDEKTLVLIRHAHRDNTDPEANNSLSKKGRKQAAHLAEHFERAFGDEKPRFLSSPKARCIETLEPIAKLFRAKIEIDDRLLEKQGSEESRGFQLRIEKFLDAWLNELSGITLICSHGDWLPLACYSLTGAPSDFKKGGWAEIARIQGKSVLRFRN